MLKDISKREGLHVEMKDARGGLPKSIWSTYSAFANTDGGVIYLGVTEEADGKLVTIGVDDPESMIKTFWDIINNPSKVNANILTDSDVRTLTSDEKQVIAITVPRAERRQKPIFINGNPLNGTFRRNGEGDYRCTQDEYKGMLRDSGAEPLDATLVENARMESLCKETISFYRRLLKTARPNHSWIALADDELLMRLGAAGRQPGESELKPTRAGLLMFGYEYEIVKEFPDYFLDYREVRSDIRWDDRVVTNDGEWSGNLLDFWGKIAPKLADDLKRPFFLDIGTTTVAAGMQRVEDAPMFKAVREALANMLVHADYFGQRYSIIIKKEDKIEFSNPGGLRIPSDIAMEGGLSDSRNPTIMKMFGLLNLCEKAGSGFSAIRQACEQSELPYPELKEAFNPDRTTLILYTQNLEKREGGHKSFALKKFPSATTEEEKVLALIEKEGRIRRTDVEELLDIGSTKAKYLLASMIEEGLVVVEGVGRGTKYRLAED